MAPATELLGHQVAVLSQGDRRLVDHRRLELDRTVLGHLARAQPQRRHFGYGRWFGWRTGLHRMAPCERREGSHTWWQVEEVASLPAGREKNFQDLPSGAPPAIRPVTAQSPAIMTPALIRTDLFLRRIITGPPGIATGIPISHALIGP